MKLCQRYDMKVLHTDVEETSQVSIIVILYGNACNVQASEWMTHADILFNGGL